MDKPVFFSDDLPRSTISRMVERGEARRLGPGIYTTDVDASPEEIVGRHWHVIAGHEFPGAVVSDRNGFTSKPVDGVLYLVHNARARELDLPGLRVTARRGAGPQDDDTFLPGGLHLTSRVRAFADNAIPSRARRSAVPRRLTRHELGEQIDQALRLDGPDRLNQYRDRARTLGPVVGVADNRLADLDDLVGVALGTRTAANLPPESPAPGVGSTSARTGSGKRGARGLLAPRPPRAEQCRDTRGRRPLSTTRRGCRCSRVRCGST